ncbi:MAG: ATP-binding protein [Vicinamibacterales bacterium]
MSRPRSLRAALLGGAGLWTLGLFIVAGIVATDMLFRYENFPRLFHRLFVNVPVAGAVAIGCLAGGVVQVRRALAALRDLGDGLTQVRAGDRDRVGGAFPREVQPLVDDLNVLLEHRGRTVQRALARAGDLAHGLKTPLAVIAHEADRGPAGAPRADVLRQQVDRMRRQIDYHLAHARAAASGAAPGATAAVGAAATALIRTLDHLHAGRGLDIRSVVGSPDVVRVQREDLDEMLGNLLDNACKWGRRQVRIAVEPRGPQVHVLVDDDGPGVPEGLRAEVLRRGVRADVAAPGTGLGLAIVADLAELYGGSIALDASPLGGARAHLVLPGAADAQ